MSLHEAYNLRVLNAASVLDSHELAGTSARSLSRRVSSSLYANPRSPIPVRPRLLPARPGCGCRPADRVRCVGKTRYGPRRERAGLSSQQATASRWVRRAVIAMASPIAIVPARSLLSAPFPVIGVLPSVLRHPGSATAVRCGRVVARRVLSVHLWMCLGVPAVTRRG